MQLIEREVPPRQAWALEQSGMHPLLARLYAARGIEDAAALDASLAQLLPPSGLKGIDAAAELLTQAIAQQQSICVVADYDCDGATACAVAVRGLRMLGAKRVSFIVPDRVVDGYGLTPAISRRVHQSGADLLITVDNGIASVEGVALARELGLRVLVTDHHLPAQQLPQANAIVNPNQPGCSFESKSMAGVGVMFYVLLALRASLRTQGIFDATTQPKLDVLLPLVALGTVADVVKLDANNRRLVAQGLQRIRRGQMPVGIAALLSVSGRQSAQCSAQDFGFAIGPRINAAGRLSDMTLGIECLLTDDAARASELATTLEKINRERRDIEGEMREQALELAQQMFDPDEPAPAALCVFDPEFHEGVVGIVAARLKDLHHRPTFVFAPSQAEGKQHELKGSGRSIVGFHLRDALDLMAKRHPGLLQRFGGHAMAAGCTLLEEDLETFEWAFQEVAQEWLDEDTLQRKLHTDGPLPAQYRQTEMAEILSQQVWGQGFAEPLFSEEFEVVSQRIVGEKHLALRLKHQGQPIDGIWFGRVQQLPARAHLAYRMQLDEWQGVKRVKFFIEGMAQVRDEST